MEIDFCLYFRAEKMLAKKTESQFYCIIMKFFLLLSLFFMFVFTPLLAQGKAVEDYIQDLSSGDMQLQEEACRYLGAKKESSSVEALISLLENSQVESPVRASAAKALASIGDKPGVWNALLQAARKNEESSLRYVAIIALTSLVNKERKGEFQELLLELEEDQDPYLHDLANKLRKGMNDR